MSLNSAYYIILNIICITIAHINAHIWTLCTKNMHHVMNKHEETIK